MEISATGHTAIAVYSYSGHSARLADKLAQALQAHVVELTAPKYRPGAIGYLRAGFDSLRQRIPRDPQSLPDLSGCDRVILCGPVWTSYPSLPLRALLQARDALPPSVSLFLTCGGHSPPEKAYALAEEDLGRSLAVKAALVNGMEGTPDEERILAEFLDAFSKVVPVSR